MAKTFSSKSEKALFIVFILTFVNLLMWFIHPKPQTPEHIHDLIRYYMGFNTGYIIAAIFLGKVEKKDEI